MMLSIFDLLTSSLTLDLTFLCCKVNLNVVLENIKPFMHELLQS